MGNVTALSWNVFGLLTTNNELMLGVRVAAAAVVCVQCHYILKNHYTL